MDQQSLHDAPTAYSDIMLGGRSCKVAGDPADLYFQSAALHATDLRKLGVIAAAVVPPNGTILDVGANIGLSVMTLSVQVPRGKVFAFEPSPHAANYLQMNVATNTSGNVEVIAAAVGAHDGILGFYQAPGFTAGSQVISEHHASSPGMEEMKVQVTTLDNFVKARNLDSVDLIKIDVEGYEPDVLLGAAETLLRFKPVVVAEMNSFALIAIRNQNPRAFIESILSTYPNVFWLDSANNLKRIDRGEIYGFIHHHLIQQHLVSDLVFCYDDSWMSRYLALV